MHRSPLFRHGELHFVIWSIWFRLKVIPAIGFYILASLKDWLLGSASMLSRPLDLNKGGSKLQKNHVDANIYCFTQVDEPILPKPVEPI